MADQKLDKRPHLVLVSTSKSQAFTAPSGGSGGRRQIPEPDRHQHGSSLRTQLAALKPISDELVKQQKEQQLEGGIGLQVQFVGFKDIDLAFESLNNETKRIELLSVKSEADVVYANVFVPEGEISHFEKYVQDYLGDRKSASGTSLDHHALLNAISSICIAEVHARWDDDKNLLPADIHEAFWWEIWLPVRGNRDAVVSDFRKLAKIANCEVSESQIKFPERTVVLMRATQHQFSSSRMMLNCVAELRRAKETAEFFDSMTAPELLDWTEDALKRLEFPSNVDETPRICLLDSGVNHGHPLLTPLMDSTDLHTVNPNWGIDDAANHGTGLAGLAAFGDLSELLGSNHSTSVTHRLESVKLTPHQGANQGDAQMHGYLFSEAVARPEISAPERPRVFTSAVTASDDRDRGRPSAWSATIDRLASDYDGDGQFPRLFVLSAGNTDDIQAWQNYPASLSTNGIRDPGQAWNALTVGAYTEKVTITEPDAQGYLPIAPAGGLSPYTSTSRTWDSPWPLKPDVVFEGGNAGQDSLGAASINSLLLLTTHNQPNERLFTTTNATSAASALCAGMAGQLMAAYPSLRPETIRALIVHSAEWTPAMRAAYTPANSLAKRNVVDLIRHCGWGIPNLNHALWSLSNSLTLVVEDQLQPYKKDPGKSVKSCDMNLHVLPWPKEQLQNLPPETQVELTVTLSYFIEPNPSARGASSKFHYPSHRLRFDVKRPLDGTVDDFVARINAAAEVEDENDAADIPDRSWLVGQNQRHRGSIHKDIWRGSAAELADHGFIAVYPAMGWWRTRPAQERYNQPARYSLIVSIRTPETDIDLYTPVAQQVAAQAAVPVMVST
jgi:hypothetical protein